MATAPTTPSASASPARVAVVTGASSGIGAATARHLARAGFQVVAGARRVARLAPLASELGAVTAPLDVTDPAAIERFAALVRERFGRADVLVNNAGLALGLSPVADGDDEDWRVMLETNVLGLLRVTRAFLPLLRAAPLGHNVNIGSIAGFWTTLIAATGSITSTTAPLSSS